MGQTYPIYVCTGTNHARHFIGSRYRLRARFKVYFFLFGGFLFNSPNLEGINCTPNYAEKKSSPCLFKS